MAITGIDSAEYEYNEASEVTSYTFVDLATGSRSHGGIFVHISGMLGNGNPTGVTWDGNPLAQKIETGAPSPSSEWWYLVDDGGGTHDLVVSLDGTGLYAFHITVVWLESTVTIQMGDSDTLAAGATDPTSLTLTTTTDNAFILAGYGTNDNEVATVSETLLQEYDSGGNCAGSSYLACGVAGNFTMDWDRNSVSTLFNASAIEIYEVGLGASPTIVLNTANDASFSTNQPTLEFTASDSDWDAVRYNIQISDDSNLGSGVTLTDSHITGI